MRRVVLLLGLVGAMGVSEGMARPALATAPVAAVAKIHCQRIFWRTRRNGTQVCPGYHDLLADEAFWYLTWSSWNAKGARGKGKLACTDSACRGQIIARMTIKLSRVRRCPDGARI